MRSDDSSFKFIQISQYIYVKVHKHENYNYSKYKYKTVVTEDDIYSN